MTNNFKPYFDRQTTGVIKGIALIMMFLHHFFTFPEWWVEGVYYRRISILSQYFRAPLKLCVPIFCFITGYFYYYNKNKTIKYSLKKISDILISYWFVFFVLAAVAVNISGYKYQTVNFIKELFAIYRPTMCFCWYVFFYMVFMMILPIIVKALSKNIHFDCLICFFLCPLLSSLLKYFIDDSIANEIIGYMNSFFPVVILGYIFSSYGFFEKMGNINDSIIKNGFLNGIIYILCLAVVPMGRWFAPKITMPLKYIGYVDLSLDVVYTPVFIYCAVNLFKIIDWKLLNAILFQIGNYSLLMWFYSCIFYNNSKRVFQPILYFPHNPIIVFIWGIILCFIPSYLSDKFVIKKLQKLKNKLFFEK